MHKIKISIQEKINTVQDILEGKEAIRAAARRLMISSASVYNWVRSYKGNGIEAFTHLKNKHYSYEYKIQVVTAYLSGEDSLYTICEKFGLKSTYQLRNWIKMYNSHERVKNSTTGGVSIMTKGRKTTFDERIEIVHYCISHEHNYSKTAAKFNISYPQARNYTLKFESGGLNALQDNRGKRKTKDSLNEVERLRAELKLERALRVHAEMEASFLKKLEEVERRRG